MENELRYAVLIDADNISEKYMEIIMEETAGNGIITYKRIYGDWTSPNLASWKKVLLDNSIIPMQQYSYTTGKNSTDAAMIIDAMDILYSKTVDGFCIVSSDSDFTRLAARLREAGMQVIGMGESKTPQPFISACNQFKYLDKLYEKKAREARKTEVDASDNSPDEGDSDTERVNKTIRAIIESFSDDDGWIFSGTLGAQLSKRLPDFDVRNFGYSKLTPFMNSLGDYEMNKISQGNHNQQIYFRLTQEGDGRKAGASRTRKTAKKGRSSGKSSGGKNK